MCIHLVLPWHFAELLQVIWRTHCTSPSRTMHAHATNSLSFSWNHCTSPHGRGTTPSQQHSASIKPSARPFLAQSLYIFSPALCCFPFCLGTRVHSFMQGIILVPNTQISMFFRFLKLFSVACALVPPDFEFTQVSHVLPMYLLLDP